MRQSPPALPPGAESAAVVLAAAGGRWEVLLREGRHRVGRWRADGWEERTSEESGVACRAAVRGRFGFAAASGRGARAGRQAAVDALDGLVQGPDPIPPSAVLGVTPVPPAPRAATCDALREAGEGLRGALARHAGVTLLELRLGSGEAHSHLLNSEGHTAEAKVSGVTAEIALAAANGPARLVQWAGRRLEDLDTETVAERAAESVLVCSLGGSPTRGLVDILLTPGAAAPLVLALVERLQLLAAGPDDPLRRSRVSPSWRLVDERAGPEGLLPQPFDGEGLPSRSHPLLAEGQVGLPPSTWAEAAGSHGAAGGAVRPSYRQAPCGGPANLVVHPTHPLAPRALLEQLDSGLWVDLPSGPLRVDWTGERFAMRAAAVAVSAGRPLASHPFVEVRGSFRRLLGGLSCTGMDSQSFSLAAAITTPSLLVRKLEIA